MKARVQYSISSCGEGRVGLFEEIVSEEPVAGDHGYTGVSNEVISQKMIAEFTSAEVARRFVRALDAGSKVVW